MARKRLSRKLAGARSNDPWGPSGSQMNEIAQATFNQQDFIEIMVHNILASIARSVACRTSSDDAGVCPRPPFPQEMMDKRLNDKGKNWRHVFKCLTLLDYLLHGGSENVVLYFQCVTSSRLHELV